MKKKLLVFERYELAKKNLRYDSASGLLYWTKNQPSGAKSGSIAGKVKSNGYVQVKLDGFKLYGHRLAWYLHYNKVSGFMIYHLDGNKSNNKISNLRENPKVLVPTDEIDDPLLNNKKHTAFVVIDGNRVNLGTFDNSDDCEREQNRVRSWLIEKAKII